MRLVSIALMLLVPAAAHAAPVIAVVAAFAGSLSVMQVVLLVGSMVYGVAQQKKAERKAQREAAAQRDAYNAGLKDRTINRIATEAAHTYIYGRARVGGLIVAMFASGGRDEYKHIVLVHAAHECDAIEEIYINGVALGALDVNGNVTTGPYVATATEQAPYANYSTVTGEIVLPHTPLPGGYFDWTIDESESGSGWGYQLIFNGNKVRVLDTQTGLYLNKFYLFCKYQYTSVTPMVRVRKHLGVPDDPADATLLAEVPGKWLPTSVLRGFCYTVIRLNLNQAEFQSGLPQFEALIRGKKLFNFRTGETRWSQNNCEVIYDYLTSEICGVDAGDLPLDQYIAAANVCDEIEEWGKKYTFNGTVASDMGQAAVLERMVQSMAGGLIATTWDIYAGKFTAPVMVLNQTDIVGSVAITPGISDADLYNGVRGQYTGDETGYVSTDFEPFQNEAYIDADGRELWTNIDFGFTDSVQRVHNLARIFTEDQRNSYMLKAQISLKAWPLKIGQRVVFSSSVFGLESKVFRVTDKKYAPASMVELSLKADDPTIWDAADAVTPSATPNTNLPNPFDIDPLAGVECQSGSEHLMSRDGTIISRILVSWPIATTSYVLSNGLIEIESQQITSDVWSKLTVSGNEVSTYLSPVEDGAIYTVRARTVNPVLNVKSDWTYAALHTVIGKSQPPADIASFMVANGAFSWPPNDELDLAGYVVRFQYGDNRSWADAANMHSGLLMASPWRPEILPPGPITVMIKAVDTSGNESVNAAAIAHNFGDTILENLILAYDDQAAGFPGDRNNAGVVDGNLVADDSGNLFWAANNAQFWLGTPQFWPVSTYKEMTYVTSYLVQPDEVGARLTLLLDVVGSSYTVEFRYYLQGAYWAGATELFWKGDSSKFWPPPEEWLTWPGAIDAVVEGEIQFRIVTQAGVVQGAINQFVLQLDVEDEYEELSDIQIGAIGTRLPIQKSYRSIKNIQLTLQDDGGAAVTAKWNDKLAIGPLIYCFNNAGLPVTGTIDARLQGVKG